LAEERVQLEGFIADVAKNPPVLVPLYASGEVGMPAELRVGSQLVVIGTMLAWKKCQRFINIWVEERERRTKQDK
jgi:hypothetical protein